MRLTLCGEKGAPIIGLCDSIGIILKLVSIQ